MERRPSSLENMEKLKGKKILVTGGTGFVGSHLVEELLTYGNSIVIPYRSRNPFSYFFDKNLDKKSILVHADLREEKNIFELLVKYEIEYVFHLAAQAIVPTAYYHPLDTFHINIMGTAYLLDAVRRCPYVRGVVVASSDKAYGKSKTVYKENDALKGDHPYEVSKSCADLIATSYFKTYGVPVVTTRFGNIYGEGDLSFSRIIPGIMQTILTRNPLEIRSDGTFTRQYLYVKDVVRGYVMLMEHIEKTKGEAFNFGSEEDMSVLDLIYQIEKILKRKVPYVIKNQSINEIPNQLLDYAKIQTMLSWKPKYCLRSTVHGILRWYTSYFRKTTI